ncbi:MAG: EF-hand domain-containing protein [Candidatus Competibacter sp.]|nr:EF-hand domain-containing protein [Candidatus Competibacter sp.]MDG4582574.1 EF-hand domain-containing protein [Candidatus Competibacter sp.]
MRALIVAVLLLAALPVFATAPLTFEEVDTDGDGLISADEAASVEGLDFDAADADADGTLSVDEYEIAVEKLELPPAAEPAAPNGGTVTPVPPPASSTPAISPDMAPKAPVAPPIPAKP